MKKQLICLILLGGMLLGSCNGYLALWKNGNPQPEQLFPFQIAVLPPQDQEALEAGIPVSSQQELSGLMEDYLS